MNYIIIILGLLLIIFNNYYRDYFIRYYGDSRKLIPFLFRLTDNTLKQNIMVKYGGIVVGIVLIIFGIMRLLIEWAGK